MKATGIVRRIDDLGRVVVPKEIRKTLRIREGDPLEIFTDREGKIILKKYSPVGELGANAAILAESIARTLGCTVCITDLDQVVAASGAGSRELKGQYISEELEHMIQERKQRTAKIEEKHYVQAVQGMGEFCLETICPIISGGDVTGAVLLLEKEEKKNPELDEKMAQGQQIFWEGRWDKMIRCHNFGDQLINYSSWREYCSL